MKKLLDIKIVVKKKATMWQFGDAKESIYCLPTSTVLSYKI
jgi:hypothetical protein